MMLAEVVIATILTTFDEDRALLQSLVERPVPHEEIDSVVRQLDDLAFFRVVNTAREGDQLQIHVEREYPIDQVVFRGNYTVLDSVILRHLTVIPRHIGDVLGWEQLQQQVRDLYWENGYLDVQVDIEMEIAEYTANLIVRVTEGRPYVVRSVIYPTDQPNLPWIIPSAFLDFTSLRERMGAWRQDMVRQGFIQADYHVSYQRTHTTVPGFSISSPFKTLLNLGARDQGVDLYINLKPGKQYRLTYDIPEGVTQEELLAQLRMERRLVIDEFELQLMEEELRRYLESNRGYHVDVVMLQLEGDHLRLNIIGTPATATPVVVQSNLWEPRIKRPAERRNEQGGMTPVQRNRLEGRLVGEMANRAIDARITKGENDAGSITWSVLSTLSPLPYAIQLQETHPSGIAADTIMRAIFARYQENEWLASDPDLLAQVVKREYGASGYLDAAAQVNRTHVGNQVALMITVDPGKQYRLDNFLILGAHRTSPRYIARLVDTTPGTIAQLEALERARFNVEGERVFSFSKMSTVAYGDQVTPVVEAEDKRNAYGAFSLGFDSSTGLSSQVKLGYTNVLGRGGEVLATHRESNKQVVSAATYNERYSFGLPVDTEYGIFREELSKNYFDFEKYGARIALRHQLTTAISVALGYDYEVTTYDAVDPRLRFGRDYDAESHYHILSATARLTKTDNPLLPTRGLEASVLLDYGLSTANRYANYSGMTLRGSLYIPPWDNGVVALHGEYGILRPNNSDSPLPLERRFYLGGANSVRGYALDSVGVDNGNGATIGGLSYTLVSTEYRHSFGNIEVVAFYDIGTVHEGELIDGDKTPYMSVGSGIRYKTLVGPVRFDVATPLTHKESANRVEWYLTLGYSF
ncbi:BamA/OMP85 family outer membrane protein [Chrysiogenes arsenatis]|uniref:BamA/OMP85 family outer membrane protein n=1 Tax=Chrysiogenes arsenatis TaxID=309797 RepID=UPI00040D6C6B|nr:BamA/TamA family outer membrane protein [Chrysiogenes arsenatis]